MNNITNAPTRRVVKINDNLSKIVRFLTDAIRAPPPTVPGTWVSLTAAWNGEGLHFFARATDACVHDMNNIGGTAGFWIPSEPVAASDKLAGLIYGQNLPILIGCVVVDFRFRLFATVWIRQFPVRIVVNFHYFDLKLIAAIV
jgi:hypothetical protein